MKVDLSVIIIWSVAVSLSGVLSALICGVTLKPKYSRAVTIEGYAAASLLGFAVTFFAYTLNITNDFVGIIGFSAIIWIAAILLGQDNVFSKLFVAIMATLIANVSTFFLAGTTISFLDNTPNPYNMLTISKFIGVKLVLFTILFLAYYLRARKPIILAVETLDKKTLNYLPISLISFFGFYAINLITNSLGIFPAIPAMRYYFIGIYGIISLIFVFEYYQIFSSIFWSSRALKTEAELNVASKIQKDMLPSIFPAFPDRSEFDIYATMIPAKEVGGDFYDFFFIDEDQLAVVMADVSGKGVPAALFMVIAKTLIKNYAQMGHDPEDVFTHVNGQLCENNDAGMFVTAWMGVLQISTGRFTYVNAGHNSPLLRRKGADFEYLKSKPGFVLAGMEGMVFKQVETSLQEGDELYLYTDGVTEATDSSGHLYGDDRLLEVINSHREERLDRLLPLIKMDIDSFVKQAPQFDDITMLALKLNERSGLGS